MPGRLKTWKEVARFFGANTRTVMRWEAERGLPIHRLPGAARSRIYAEVDELDAWLRANEGLAEAGAEPATVTPPPAAKPRRSRWLWIAGGVAVVALGTLGFTLAPPLFPHVPPPAARALYDRGEKAWRTRTPAGLNAAVDDFNQAIRLDPHYADAYVGLADVYNLMSEYTAMPAAQAFPLARTAAQTAIALDDRSGDAHAALAFALFYGFWETENADREFRRALSLEPRCATIHHWYGTYLHTRGRNGEALAQLDTALRIEPASQAIAADRAVLLLPLGRDAEAERILKGLAQADPAFRSPHTYLSQLYRSEGRDAEFLDEDSTSARLAGDLYGQNVDDAARAGLKAGGHDGMVRALLKSQLDLLQNGNGSAYRVAQLYAELHDLPPAVTYLRLAVQRNDELLMYLPLDTSLTALKGIDVYDDTLRKLGN